MHFAANAASNESSLLLNDTEKIIGEKNFIPVDSDGANLPSELRPFLDAIGQLNVGCTATHIGGGLVLTAGHCISTSPRASSNQCRQLGVVWGNRGGNKSLSVSKCVAIKMRVYQKMGDFALLEVSHPPSASIQIDFETSEFPAEVTMLSFPRMRPLEWSGECEMRPHDDPVLVLKKFLHTCDSESGSSGAPIISRHSLKIIGVHGGSGDELNYGTLTNSLSELKTFIQNNVGD